MNKFFVAFLSVLSVASISHGYVVNDTNREAFYVDENTMTHNQKNCSKALYSELSIHSSKADVACTGRRSDPQFVGCVVNLTQYLDKTATDSHGRPHSDNVMAAGESCNFTNSPQIGICATELFLRAGLYIWNAIDPIDGIRACASPAGEQIKACILGSLRNGHNPGVGIALTCYELNDPVAKARKEEERRRVEEQRLIEEQRRQDQVRRQQQEEQRRQDELRRQQEQRRMEEQRRQDEMRRQQEQRRQDEIRRQSEAQRAAELQRQDQQRQQQYQAQQEQQRRQAEQNRIEEQQRQKRLDDLIAQQDQKHSQQQQDDAKKRQQQQQDEQKKQNDAKAQQEEARRKQLEEQRKQQQEAANKKKQDEDKKRKEEEDSKKRQPPIRPPDAPASSSSGEGVIVDLPNLD